MKAGIVDMADWRSSPPQMPGALYSFDDQACFRLSHHRALAASSLAARASLSQSLNRLLRWPVSTMGWNGQGSVTAVRAHCRVLVVSALHP